MDRNQVFVKYAEAIDCLSKYQNLISNLSSTEGTFGPITIRENRKFL